MSLGTAVSADPRRARGPLVGLIEILADLTFEAYMRRGRVCWNRSDETRTEGGEKRIVSAWVPLGCDGTPDALWSTPGQQDMKLENPLISSGWEKCLV
jgi:hypothetical protein